MLFFEVFHNFAKSCSVIESLLLVMHFISLHLLNLATLTATQRRGCGGRRVFAPCSAARRTLGAVPRRIFRRANFVLKVRSMYSGLYARYASFLAKTGISGHWCEKIFSDAKVLFKLRHTSVGCCIIW